MKLEFSLDSQSIKDALGILTSLADGEDDKRFDNILFHIKHDKLNLVATNNAAILIYSIPVTPTQTDIKFTVPKSIVRNLKKSLTDNPRTTIAINKNIYINNISVPLKNEFPDYENTMSKYISHKHRPVTVATNAFLSSLRKACYAMSGKDLPPYAQIHITNDTLTVTPGYYILFREFSVSMPCASDINITLYFNLQLLLFYFRHLLSGDKTTMWIYKKAYPVVFSNSESGFTNPTYAVMPLRDPLLYIMPSNLA